MNQPSLEECAQTALRIVSETVDLSPLATKHHVEWLPRPWAGRLQAYLLLQWEWRVPVLPSEIYIGPPGEALSRAASPPHYRTQHADMVVELGTLAAPRRCFAELPERLRALGLPLKRTLRPESRNAQ